MVNLFLCLADEMLVRRVICCQNRRRQQNRLPQHFFAETLGGYDTSHYLCSREWHDTTPAEKRCAQNLRVKT